MIYWTYDQIKTKVEQDLDLQEETIIESSEMMGYCNEAIAEAEAHIHDLNEDYFLSDGSLTMVQGTSEYDLPANMYGQKIRSVIYQNGATLYEVPRIRKMNKFLYAKDVETNGTSDDYSYMLVNRTAAAGVKMKLYPASREDGAYITLWYLRGANRITATTDYCDIPEWYTFIVQFMKVRCYEKEGNPKYVAAKAKLDELRDLMLSTLSDRIADEDNEIPADLSHYEDMS